MCVCGGGAPLLTYSYFFIWKIFISLLSLLLHGVFSGAFFSIPSKLCTDSKYTPFCLCLSPYEFQNGAYSPLSSPQSTAQTGTSEGISSNFPSSFCLVTMPNLSSEGLSSLSWDILASKFTRQRGYWGRRCIWGISSADSCFHPHPSAALGRSDIFNLCKIKSCALKPVLPTPPLPTAFASALGILSLQYVTNLFVSPRSPSHFCLLSFFHGRNSFPQQPS